MRPRSRKEIADQLKSDQSSGTPQGAKPRKLFGTEFLQDHGQAVGPEGEELPPSVSWRYTAPSWVLIASSCGIGLAVFATTFAFEVWLKRSSTLLVAMLGSDFLAGLLAGLLQYHTLRSFRRRRAMVLHRLQLIADMNHHIRNALEVIQLSTALVQKPEVTQIINESTDRITWALQEILGNEPLDRE